MYRHRASPKGTCVRLLKFPAEGRVVRDAQGIDVGDKVQVRLAAVDVAKGFIDLEARYHQRKSLLGGSVACAFIQAAGRNL